MHLALEEFLPDNGIDDDHEEDQQGDVEEGHHGLDDGVQDDLKALGTRWRSRARSSRFGDRHPYGKETRRQLS